MSRTLLIGGGHVGLVSAVCFADRGYDTILYERDVERAELIQAGRPPFFEPNLEGLLKKTIDGGKLQISTNLEEAISDSEIAFVAIGTPSRPNGSINLTSIETSSAELGEALRSKAGYCLIVMRTTVIPGTTENLVKPTLEKHSGKDAGEDFGLAMQPEFLREGSAIEDTLSPDRIVIGEYDKRSGDVLETFYLDFYKGRAPPIIRMNLACAEMVKYASNAFLATKISFINQIANICEKIPGVDVARVADAMGLDKRIGGRFLNAGAGFGGSCLGKDLSALIAFSKQFGCKPNLLEAVLDVNEKQALNIVESARQQLGDLVKKRIAILGLSFKPNTDDMRDAPSVRIVKRLLDEGASVVVYDPAAMKNASAIFKDQVDYAKSGLECVSNADCAIIVTEWDEFRKFGPDDFKEKMRCAVLIDGRKIYDPLRFSKELNYVGIGLGSLI